MMSWRKSHADDGVKTMEAVMQVHQRFVVSVRARMNRYLNKVLWFFIATGPAIALGIWTGIFPNIDYITCAGISLLVALLSAIHLVMVKRLPNSIVTSVFALVALDILIALMPFSHVNVRLTWFLVPLLSILFCDRRVYCFAVVSNYVFMVATTWLTAPYFASQSGAFANEVAYFGSTIGGLTIESIIMATAGYFAVKLAANHYEGLFRQQEVIEAHEKDLQEKVDVLDSMVEIYDNVNLISFIDNTEMPLRDSTQEKHVIDMPTQTHTLMNQRLKDRIMPDQLEGFLEFTDITTVRNRLKDKKIISADFIDVMAGWLRAQYITVEAAWDGRPNVVIYTTRNVDEEKKREERLLKLSMTDELTRLYNRRCFVEDLEKLGEGALEGDLVVFSIDVNGLKLVNDTLGHAAGDELIKGAADCLVLSVGQLGKVYRTGGDEFMALVHMASPEDLRERIHEKAGEWHGTRVGELSVSVGYAAHADHCEATVDDLEHMADADMYVEKERYYQEAGIDQRKHR